MRQFTDSAKGERAEIPLGQSFEIALTENPSTGFRWRLNAGGSPLCAITLDEFDPSPGIGSQGRHFWRFDAKKTGETEITIVLQRSWTPAAPPAQTFNLRVAVTGRD